MTHTAAPQPTATIHLVYPKPTWYSHKTQDSHMLVLISNYMHLHHDHCHPFLAQGRIFCTNTSRLPFPHILICPAAHPPPKTLLFTTPASPLAPPTCCCCTFYHHTFLTFYRLCIPLPQTLPPPLSPPPRYSLKPCIAPHQYYLGFHLHHCHLQPTS